MVFVEVGRLGFSPFVLPRFILVRGSISCPIPCHDDGVLSHSFELACASIACRAPMFPSCVVVDLMRSAVLPQRRRGRTGVPWS